MLGKKIIIAILILLGNRLFSSEITNYRVINLPFISSQGKLLIATRSFTMNRVLTYLVINPFTLKTSLYKGVTIHSGVMNIMDFLSFTPYFRLLRQCSQDPFLLQNYGLKKSAHFVKGYCLTVDLCPSISAFDKQLFIKLQKYRQGDDAIPVALCVSGLWLKKHLSELNWLLEQQRQNKITITWVNHSWSHPYYRQIPLRENFLLAKGVSFEQEVLNVEKYLLKKGIIPSVFFRFPGLVSNKSLVLKLLRMNLFPLGSSSWMAKGETPKFGSVILVHGNGNEPDGLTKLFLFLAKKEKMFGNGQLNFYPLESIF